MKNLTIRTLTGIVYVAVIVGGLLIHPCFYLAVFSVIVALALWEFYGLLTHFDHAFAKKAVNTIGGVYLFAALFLCAKGVVGTNVLLPYLLFLMYVFISELYDKKSNPINSWAFTLLPQVYIAASISLLNFIVLSKNDLGEVVFNPLFGLAIFAFIWLNDTGAYLVGSLIGKRRLFERISPKKSWEGFGGGLLLVLLSSQLVAYFLPEISWFNWLGLSATIVVFATWGDLVESLMKRTIGVKDSGTLFPGHGGMLDRFDSVMMAIPAAYIYFELFIRN